MGAFDYHSRRPATLRDQIVAEIRDAVLQRKLRPGDHVPEKELTQRLKVSRTPVREALILLEQEGLLVNYPNRGCYVRSFDAQDIREIFELRFGLECLAAQLIYERIQPDDLGEMRRMITRVESMIAARKGNLADLEWRIQEFFVKWTGNARLLAAWRAVNVQVYAVADFPARAEENGDVCYNLADYRLVLEAYASGVLARILAAHRNINARLAEQCIERLTAKDGVQRPILK